MFKIDKSLNNLDKSIAQNNANELSDCSARFYDGIIEFIDSILTVLPNETPLVVAKVYIQTKISKEKLIKKYIKNILPLADAIARRDDSFIDGQYLDALLNENSMFKIDFYSIWQQLDAGNRDLTWQWLEAFNKLARIWLSSGGGTRR